METAAVSTVETGVALLAMLLPPSSLQDSSARNWGDFDDESNKTVFKADLYGDEL